MTETLFRHGAGRLCLDFIRTLRYRGTAEATEELADATALSVWIDQIGPREINPADPPTAAQVRQARSLREAIHELITARMATGSAGVAARRCLNQAASRSVPAPRLDDSGRLRWHADDGVEAFFAVLARDALDLATSPAITRVRACANQTCGALFLDSSRPGTRRWCSMDTCGNQAKKAVLRGRR